MKINGYVKYEYDEKIRFDFVECFPKNTDLVIRSTHVGLSKGDVFIMENAWKGTIYPAIGTAENIGIVEKVGKSTHGFEVGDRVGVGYILKSCMRCDYCKSGHHQYCEKQINTELGGWGGMAEKMVIDYRLVVKIPKGIESELAAPLMCYGVTAWSGIKKAMLPKKSKVGVIGLGGMGQIMVKLLVAMGHEVTVFSHSPNKATVAKGLGVSNFVLTTNKNWSRGMHKYFGLIINASPANFELDEYIVLLSAVGKFGYLGLPFNKQSFQTTKLADYSSRFVYGSYVGSISEMAEMLDFVVKNKIRPEIIMFPIVQYERAMEQVKMGFPYKRTVLAW